MDIISMSFAFEYAIISKRGVKTLEEKMFELMEKLYGEFKSLDAKVGSIDAKVGGLDAKVESLDEKVGSLKKDVLRIENKLDTNSKALFDGYSQSYEKLTAVETKVDKISSKVEKQDVEIRVIKGVK